MFVYYLNILYEQLKKGKGAYSSSWNSPQQPGPSPQTGRLVLDLSTP